MHECFNSVLLKHNMDNLIFMLMQFKIYKAIFDLLCVGKMEITQTAMA